MPKNRNFEEELDSLFKELKESENKDLPSSYNPAKQKGETRSKIALQFTKWFFGLIVITFVGTLTYNFLIDRLYPSQCLKSLELKDTILLVSGTLGGMYGLVLGYYFKGGDKEDN